MSPKIVFKTRQKKQQLSGLYIIYFDVKASKLGQQAALSDLVQLVTVLPGPVVKLWCFHSAVISFINSIL